MGENMIINALVLFLGLRFLLSSLIKLREGNIILAVYVMSVFKKGDLSEAVTKITTSIIFGFCGAFAILWVIENLIK